MASKTKLQEELDRLRNYKAIAPPSTLQNMAELKGEDEDEEPKDWEFTGSVEELDMSSLIDSLTRPADEIDYSTPESIANINQFAQDYGDFLYQTKYSHI